MNDGIKKGLLNLRNFVILVVIFCLIITFELYDSGLLKDFIFFKKQLVMYLEKSGAESIEFQEEAVAMPEPVTEELTVEIVEKIVEEVKEVPPVAVIEPEPKIEDPVTVSPPIAEAVVEKKKQKFILLGPYDPEDHSTEVILAERSDRSSEKRFVIHGPVDIPEEREDVLTPNRKNKKGSAKVREPLFTRAKKIVKSKLPRKDPPKSEAVIVAAPKKEEKTPEPVLRPVLAAAEPPVEKPAPIPKVEEKPAETISSPILVAKEPVAEESEEKKSEPAAIPAPSIAAAEPMPEKLPPIETEEKPLAVIKTEEPEVEPQKELSTDSVLFTSVLNALKEQSREVDPGDVMTLAEVQQFMLNASLAVIDQSSKKEAVEKPVEQETLSENEPSEEIAAFKDDVLEDYEIVKEKVKEFFAGTKKELEIIKDRAKDFLTGNVKEEDDWDPYPWPKTVTASHYWGDQEHGCAPFATNYSTLDMLIAPDYRPGHFLPLLDLGGHRFDNNTYAANIGVGTRYIPTVNSGFSEMLGFNAFYDYRQGGIGYYNQFGFGIEVLGRRWDFRGNLYVPFGRKRHTCSCLFNQYIGDYFAIRRDIETVSYSFNGEVGYLAVNGKNFSLYFAAGPYFLARKNLTQSSAGIEGRIRPKYRDYLSLDLSARYDGLFGTIWQAEFIFTLPLYQISNRNKRPAGLRDWQIYQPIERFEVMPLSKNVCWESNF